MAYTFPFTPSSLLFWKKKEEQEFTTKDTGLASLCIVLQAHFELHRDMYDPLHVLYDAPKRLEQYVNTAFTNQSAQDYLQELRSQTDSFLGNSMQLRPHIYSALPSAGRNAQYLLPEKSQVEQMILGYAA